MSFTKFKNVLLEYFSNPNTIIQLQNEFNTIKQSTSKTVTQYLAQFNRIYCQIETIEQGYYTDLQVLNQFIRGLKSSILGRVCPAHPNSLSKAVMLTRAFESAKKEANHSQIVNIVMKENKTETLEKRVTQLGEKLSKKIESYLIPDPKRNTYQPLQRHSQKRNPNHIRTSQQTNPNYQNYQQTYLNILKNLIIGNNDGRNINKTENSSNKLSQTISPVVATKDSSFAAIFSFELKENEAMFSGAALNKKHPITTMYIKTTVNNTPIKLILDSRFAESIVML
ncbi:hypothetical protein G9A89_002115 [Geosiphon pyriformis]|nr:hypothetical protein G9A89_002115 [Geosiphon pyriformis]